MASGDVYEKVAGAWVLRANIGGSGQAEGWYSGLGAPGSGLGAVGDWYLDTTPGAVVSSGATVASTVAGLGAPADGKLGLLRVGATPFDFLGLTYDATSGKWVSPVVQRLEQGTTAGETALADASSGTWGKFSGTSGMVAGTYPISSVHLKSLFKAYTDAGLTPQARMHGFVGSTSSAATCLVKLHQYHWNLGDAMGAQAPLSSLTSAQAAVTMFTQAAATITFKDSGWVTFTNPATPKDAMALILEIVLGATMTFGVQEGAMELRWVG